MKRVRLVLHTEDSDYAYAVLVGHGIDARFVRRGPNGDVISVPAQDGVRARRVLDALSR
jgi:hypothetical protein